MGTVGAHLRLRQGRVWIGDDAGPFQRLRRCGAERCGAAECCQLGLESVALSGEKGEPVDCLGES